MVANRYWDRHDRLWLSLLEARLRQSSGRRDLFGLPLARTTFGRLWTTFEFALVYWLGFSRTSFDRFWMTVGRLVGRVDGLRLLDLSWICFGVLYCRLDACLGFSIVLGLMCLDGALSVVLPHFV